MKKIFLSLFFVMSAQAECEKVETKIIFDKKPVMNKEVLCSIVTADKTKYYVSKSCEKDNCEILKRKPKDLKVEKYSHNIGSPGFKLCVALDGIPQIFEFRLDKKSVDWESTSRCLFGKNDFVEISLLMSKWKGFIY